MSFPPLPVHAYQHWVCWRCRKMFLWDTSKDMQLVIEHALGCKGDRLAQIAGEQIGAHRRE